MISSKGAKRRTVISTPVGMATVMLVLAFILSLVPTDASAANIAGTSNTYLQSRQTVDDSNLLPIYEYLDFSVQDLGKESISIHFGGWLGYDLQDNSFGGDDKKKGSDLQYGYVSYRRSTGNSLVNVGRIMVFEGIAAERVDGIYARTDLMKGFGISAFGGAPVETNINMPGNNTIYGGRVSQQNAGLYTIGLSYLKEDKNSDTYRKEGAIDVWVRPVNKVELTGRSSYNFQTTGWMEHAYYLMFGPFDKLRVNAEATWINYGDYFMASTSSAFKMTPGGALDPNEKVSILGPEVFYAINDKWAVSAVYKSYSYDIAGSASYYGAKLTFRVPKSYSAGISAHKMDGDTDRLQYDEYRVYASKRMHKLDVTLDLVDVKFKQSINNVSNAYSATLAAGYELSERLALGADLEYAKNPDFDKDVRLFAKMTYRFDVTKGHHAAATSETAGQPVKSPPVAAPPAAPVVEPAAAPAAEPAAAPAPAAEPEKAKEGNP